MLLPGPVELACARGETGKLCDRNEALFDLGRKYGTGAAFTPAGLLILCRGNAANPAASAVSTCDRRISTPTTIHVAAGHMHLLGAAIRLELNPGTSRAKVLLDIPRWDFHWQNAYTLARSVQAEPGDVVRVTCRHDASKRTKRGYGGSDDTALRPVGRRHDRRDVPRDPAGHARVTPLRILLVSQMYPGPDDPDLGVFVANLEHELAARGHELERAVVDTRAGGPRRHMRLFRDAARIARRFRPDVAYAHFLVPAGLAAALATRAPLVVTAHGQDVANIGSKAGVRAATRHVVRQGELGDRRVGLAARPARGSSARRTRQDRGDRLRRRPRALRAARRRSGAAGRRLERRRHCVSLPRRAHGAQERPPSRTCVRAPRRRDADLRRRRPAPRRPRRDANGIRVVGRVGHDEVPTWIAASDVVCQPSLVEPFGLATLEAMASARSVVATTVGGPPEFVTPESGVLVDPLDDDALVSGALTRRFASSAQPRRPRRRRRPRRQAAGGTGGGGSPASRLEIGEPDLDERSDRRPRDRPHARRRAPPRRSRAPSRARLPASGDCRP